MAEETVSIEIPKSMAEKIEERMKETEFASISDYIIFVLKEVVEEDSEEVFSKEDEEKVKERLRSLGYLD